jgi:hypothetical protein
MAGVFEPLFGSILAVAGFAGAGLSLAIAKERGRRVAARQS